ncbi:MAG TPA: signal peptidase I [Gemmatimonadales bacterium]|nr:signal peptidase I [Gemmatimonadales bacterium]
MSEAAKTAPAAEQPRKTFGRWLWEWVKSLAVALAIWFVLRALLIEAFRIPSSSMERTLLVGDFLFVNKALYGAELPLIHTRLPAFREPRLHDIVVFDSKLDPGVKVVKRVVGVPGDTLEMRDNVLFRNGVRQIEPWVIRTDSSSDPGDPEMRLWQLDYLLAGVERETYRPTRGNWGPIVVPAGQYFVLGDNRDNSLDSRYWGFVDRRVIRGRPLFVYYSFDRTSWRALPFLTAIRWSRIGSRPR